MKVNQNQSRNEVMIRSSPMFVESCCIDNNGCVNNGLEKRNDNSTDTIRTLSSYEKQRALKIEKNNSRLRALGLISEEEEEHSNAAAWGSTTTPSRHPKSNKTSSSSSSSQNLTSSSMPTIQQRIKISSRGRKQKVLKKNSDGNNDKNQIKDNQALKMKIYMSNVMV